MAHKHSRRARAESDETADISRRELLRGAPVALVGAAALGSVGDAYAAPQAGAITLLESHVAGTFYAGVEKLLPGLEVGDPLLLRREPANPYDALAILVLTRAGTKLGYVPRVDNRVLAALLDAGVALDARITAIRPGDWHHLDLVVTMPLPVRTGA